MGMILWPGAKRSVGGALAAEIAAAAREGGAQPVGVFVDERAEEVSNGMTRFEAIRVLGRRGELPDRSPEREGG